MRHTLSLVVSLSLLLIVGLSCNKDKSANSEAMTVPHAGQFGIYALNLTSGRTSLLYTVDNEIKSLCLNHSGTRLAFAVKKQTDVTIDTTSEIYVLDIATRAATQLTDNSYFDIYPSFSPDDSSIVFLSVRDADMDLYLMNAHGADQHLLYNSGGHDGDVNWGSGGRIAFTRDSQIWSIAPDGTGLQPITDPPDAGVWGNADLPMGDYDPRYSPDGTRLTFERMVDVSYTHGGYDIFVASADGTNEINLTNTGSSGYAQGLPNWSHSGDRLIYILAAVVDEGRYDLCMINVDGTDNRVITPGYYPATFLCRNAVFSDDDAQVYFIGQWWQ